MTSFAIVPATWNAYRSKSFSVEMGNVLFSASKSRSVSNPFSRPCKGSMDNLSIGSRSIEDSNSG